MSRLLRALEKAGLVELEDGAMAASEHAEPDAAAEESSPPPQSATSPDTADVANNNIDQQATAIDTDRPLADLYAEYEVGESPFPAEKLLKLLDGLRALDPAARKAAILALDAADDEWTIDDALLDAEHKVRALNQAREALQQKTAAAEASANEQLQVRERQQEESVGRIRKQITDLEGLLEREIARASEDKAAIQATARQVRQDCQRETVRLNQESARLHELARIFATGEND